MYRRILVPHDGSAFAEQVLPHATELAERFGAEIHLLEVIAPPNPALYANDLDSGAGAEVVTEALEEAQEELRVRGRERLTAVAKQLTEQGISAVWKVTDGDPAREIMAYEQEQDIDLVAMTSHGRTGLARAVLGSVTDTVLREGGRPVLVIRAQETVG
jgi:nucleotide-binding universal stress UspA family protein